MNYCTYSRHLFHTFNTCFGKEMVGTGTISKASIRQDIRQASFQKKRYGKSNTHTLKRNGTVQVSALAALVDAFDEILPKAKIIAVLFADQDYTQYTR